MWRRAALASTKDLCDPKASLGPNSPMCLVMEYYHSDGRWISIHWRW